MPTEKFWGLAACGVGVDSIREAMRKASKMPPDEAQQHVAKTKRMIDEMQAISSAAASGQLDLLPEL